MIDIKRIIRRRDERKKQPRKDKSKTAPITGIIQDNRARRRRESKIQVGSTKEHRKAARKQRKASRHNKRLQMQRRVWDISVPVPIIKEIIKLHEAGDSVMFIAIQNQSSMELKLIAPKPESKEEKKAA